MILLCYYADCTFLCKANKHSIYLSIYIDLKVSDIHKLACPELGTCAPYKRATTHLFG